MHNLQVRRHYAALKGFYLFAFLGTGSMIPLLSMYLTKEQHLSGSQVGLIMSLGPIVMIFFQPFWGMLSDYTQKTKGLLAVCTSITGIIGLAYIAFDSFPLFILIAACFAAFQTTFGQHFTKVHTRNKRQLWRNPPVWFSRLRCRGVCHGTGDEPAVPHSRDLYLWLCLSMHCCHIGFTNARPAENKNKGQYPQRIPGAYQQQNFPHLYDHHLYDICSKLSEQYVFQSFSGQKRRVTFRYRHFIFHRCHFRNSIYEIRPNIYR